MHVEPHHTAEELAILAAELPRVPRWRRLRAVILARQVRTAEAISAALGRTPRAVQKWVARYNRGGADALADRPGRRGLASPVDVGLVRIGMARGPSFLQHFRRACFTQSSDVSSCKLAKYLRLKS